MEKTRTHKMIYEKKFVTLYFIKRHQIQKKLNEFHFIFRFK